MAGGSPQDGHRSSAGKEDAGHHRESYWAAHDEDEESGRVTSWYVMRVRDRKPERFRHEARAETRLRQSSSKRRFDATHEVRTSTHPSSRTWLSMKQSIGSRAPAHAPPPSSQLLGKYPFLELAYMRRKGLEASSRLDFLNANSSQSRDLPVRPVFLNRYRYSTGTTRRREVVRVNGCVGRGLQGLDGCEVRLCDPCACVRPCVPCVFRLPPVSFYRCLFTVPVHAGSGRLRACGCSCGC